MDNHHHDSNNGDGDDAVKSDGDENCNDANYDDYS